MAKKKSPTNDTTRAILSYLFANKIYAWRNNTTGIFDPTTGKYRTAAKKGVADILGLLRNGRFLAIEVKTGRDMLSEEQEGFKTQILASGGISLVVKDFEDFLNQFENFK